MGWFLKGAASALLIAASAMLWNTFTNIHFKPEELRGKRVLVTGASKNIGKQIALEYAHYRAKVVVTARREDKLKEVVEECKKVGAQDAHYIVADMSNLGETKRVIEKAVSLLGGLDHLVLNHIVGMDSASLWNSSSDNLNFATKSATVNYLSYIYLSSYAAPYLSESDGHLIVISSLAGHVNFVRTAAYGATKAAVNHFYANLRLELALQERRPYSITICLLGPINTDDSKWKQWSSNKSLKGTSMLETAQEVVKAGAARQAYVFIPRWSILTSFFRMMATDHFDKLLLYFA